VDTNVSQSNARLRAVSSPKSDTSINVSTANKLATNVASSKDQGISTIGSGDQDFKKTTSNVLKNSSKPRASFEGYMQAPTAHIQNSGHGYDNPKNQQARQKSLAPKKAIQEFSSKPLNLQSNSTKNGIINNYTKSSLTGSSKSILDKSLKINRSF
jgi:hypothetical protein